MGTCASKNHLNFSRQVIRQFVRAMRHLVAPHEVKEALKDIIHMLRDSVKVQLPMGGRLYDDPQYKALDETEPLRLPFPVMTLEYLRESGSAIMPDGTLRSSKQVVVLQEVAKDISITPISYVDYASAWMPYPDIFLPKVGYLDRTDIERGRVGIMAVGDPLTVRDSEDEVGATLCLLNALQCSNVRIEKSAARQPKKTRRKKVPPFDDYYFLTVELPGSTNGAIAYLGGSHRSPREHISRGHIRRYKSGLRVWVNSTIVNAGNRPGGSKGHTLFHGAAGEVPAQRVWGRWCGDCGPFSVDRFFVCPRAISVQSAVKFIADKRFNGGYWDFP